MFEGNNKLEDCTKEEKKKAFERYLDALSASVRGTGCVFLQRGTKDLFTNNYNRKLMQVHQANHDIQIVVDQYACAQYVVGYLTKNESGMSKLSNMETLNQLSSVLDKHREVSIQEATYRILSLPMVKLINSQFNSNQLN